MLSFEQFGGVVFAGSPPPPCPMFSGIAPPPPEPAAVCYMATTGWALSFQELLDPKL